jgi:hypothetical protein
MDGLHFFFFGDEKLASDWDSNSVRLATSLVALPTGAENIRNVGVGGTITLKRILEQ